MISVDVRQDWLNFDQPRSSGQKYLNLAFELRASQNLGFPTITCDIQIRYENDQQTTVAKLKLSKLLMLRIHETVHLSNQNTSDQVLFFFSVIEFARQCVLFDLRVVSQVSIPHFTVKLNLQKVITTLYLTQKQRKLV